MHHAPAGPPSSARVAALLARVRFRTAPLLAALGATAGLARRTRALSLGLGALVLAALSLAPPLTPQGSAPAGPAAHASSGGQSLVPATGEGWTEDGAVPQDEAGPQDGAASRAERPAPRPTATAPAPAEVPAEPSATEEVADEPPAQEMAQADGTGSAATPGTPAADAPAAVSSGSRGTPPAPRAPGPRSPVAPPSASPPSSSAPPVTAESADGVLATIGAARSAAGCAALGPDAGLAALAAEHSADMADDEEASAPSAGAPVALVASGSDAASVASAWLADDAALLDCSLTAVGVAAVDGWWTLLAA